MSVVKYSCSTSRCAGLHFYSCKRIAKILFLFNVHRLLNFTVTCLKFVLKLTTYLGYAVVQLVEALRYKSEGRGFDSRWCHWNFSLTSFGLNYGPGVDSAFNRNEYQEYFLGGKGGRCVGLTTLPSSCADCLEF
jgi:hypothetical protein